MKYIYSKKSEKYFINDKVQSSYVQCTLEEIKKPIHIQLLVEHDVQSNKIEHNVYIKNIYIIQYTLTFIIKKIQDVHIIPYFCSKMLYLKKKIKWFFSQLSRQIFIYFQIQIELNST
jgi:hypothetical protein